MKVKSDEITELDVSTLNIKENDIVVAKIKEPVSDLAYTQILSKLRQFINKDVPVLLLNNIDLEAVDKEALLSMVKESMEYAA